MHLTETIQQAITSGVTLCLCFFYVWLQWGQETVRISTAVLCSLIVVGLIFALLSILGSFPFALLVWKWSVALMTTTTEMFIVIYPKLQTCSIPRYYRIKWLWLGMSVLGQVVMAVYGTYKSVNVSSQWTWGYLAIPRFTFFIISLLKWVYNEFWDWGKDWGSLATPACAALSSIILVIVQAYLEYDMYLLSQCCIAATYIPIQVWEGLNNKYDMYGQRWSGLASSSSNWGNLGSSLYDQAKGQSCN